MKSIIIGIAGGTGDHRVIDGADGARFITIINNTLSDIRRLVM